MATQPEARTAIAAPRKPARIGGALRALLPLLPGIAFLIFWEWASGRLIREMYVSRPSDVAVICYRFL